MSFPSVFLIHLVVFGVGPLVFFLLARMLQRPYRSEVIGLPRFIPVALFVWWGCAIALASIIGLSELSFFVAFLIPVSLVSIGLFNAQISDILTRIPLHLLVALSTYRVAGAIFLYLYYAEGTLSAGFALNAGWGDVITGVLAAPVAYCAWKKSSYFAPAFLLWSIIGIGDLILAPASAILFGPLSLADFPLNLIPLLIGPPFGIALHLITLRAFWLQRDNYPAPFITLPWKEKI